MTYDEKNTLFQGLMTRCCGHEAVVMERNL